MAIGPIDHVYYWTRDMDAAVAFYAEIVGLRLIQRQAEWAEFEAGPIRFALHGTEGHEVPPGGTIVLEVDDLDSARWTLEHKGVSFDPHVGEVEGMARFASFRDPDGNPVQLIEYTSRSTG